MLKFKTWISAARPRTLPLSVSGIIAGSGLALREGDFNGLIFLLALLTTLGLQILSNFANDYGDGVKGTDNDERIGPMRALQSGIITDKEMKKAMIWTSLITFALAIALIFIAFGSDQVLYVILFLILGIAAIAAAIKYTVGNTAYGYRGLGDVFVFLFFGLLSTVGSYFLYAKQLNSLVWILAVIIGFLSTAVLNLNNMRDRRSDLKSGKHTLVVFLGASKAKKYHFGLIIGSFVLMVIYIILEQHLLNLLLLVSFIPLLLHLKKVYTTKNPKDLDPELKKVALSTVLFSMIYLIIGIIIA